MLSKTFLSYELCECLFPCYSQKLFIAGSNSLRCIGKFDDYREVNEHERIKFLGCCLHKLFKATILKD